MADWQPCSDPWRAHLTDTIVEQSNGLTADEREFLRQKRDGEIAPNTGWSEWNQKRAPRGEKVK